MHKLSLVKIQWYLLKLLSGNENIDMSRSDNSVKNWRNLPISNPNPDLHNINAHTVKLNSSNTNGSFTMDHSNSFLSPYEILPIGPENKYLGKCSDFIMKLYVVRTH